MDASVMNSWDVRPSRVSSTIRSPTSRAIFALAAEALSMVVLPMGARPMASAKTPMVLAVPYMEQVPQEAHILLRYLENVSAEIFPDVTLPMDSFRSQVTHVALS